MSEKKTILITGATSGIGLDAARYLDELGYELVLTGRNKDKLDSVSKELNVEHYYVCDLSETENIGYIFDYCKHNKIKLDGMLHAAGYVINMPIRSYKFDHAEMQMKLNYYAFLELCKCFYSRMVSNDNSSILAISSLASVTKLQASALYAASKNALNTVVSVASKEFVKRSIRVNALMPAYVDTSLTDGLEELIDIKEKQPFGMIPPRDISYVIEFLLSDKSKYITGTMIPVSAGMEF